MGRNKVNSHKSSNINNYLPSQEIRISLTKDTWKNLMDNTKSFSL